MNSRIRLALSFILAFLPSPVTNRTPISTQEPLLCERTDESASGQKYPSFCTEEFSSRMTCLIVYSHNLISLITQNPAFQFNPLGSRVSVSVSNSKLQTPTQNTCTHTQTHTRRACIFMMCMVRGRVWLLQAVFAWCTGMVQVRSLNVKHGAHEHGAHEHTSTQARTPMDKHGARWSVCCV